MSIDVSRRESLCPLCKSITNTLVPHTTTSTPATAIHMSDAATMLPLASQEFCVLATHAGPRAPWHNVAKEVEPNDVTLGSCFSRSMERGKLLSDGMFYDSCAQQSRFSWDHDTSDEPKISRNVDLLRTQHGVWSAAAYTLLSATCNKIRDRASSTSDAQDPTAPTLMCLSDLDTSLLKHMLALVWRSPSSMRYYYDYVSEPLLNLFEGAHFAVPRFQGGTAPKPVMRPADQFLTKSAQLTDIQRSLRSMPYESVAASFYPNTRTVASIARLAIDKGLPEQEAWAVLMMPLLVQDLHVIAVATVASSATLEAFVGLNQLLCVAKLVQTLLEPALNGQVDYFHDVVEGNVKKVDGPSKGQSQLSSLKGDCKHAHSFESGADNTPSKRSKTTDNNRDTTARVQDSIVCARGDPIASRAPSSFDTAIASLTQLREQACSAAGVPLTSKAPQGWNLLALALDSWIPYLEYAFHLRTLVFSISGVNVASHTTLLVPSGANFSVQSDVHHQHLRYKFIHAEQLMQGWGIASMEELVTVPLFVHLVQQWAGHLKVHYAAMDGAAESIEDGTSNSANATPPASGASGAGTTWIPTVPSDANRHTDSAHKHSSTSNQDLKSKDTSPTPRGLKIGAEGLPAASDGAALDIALRTMLMGIDPEAPLAVSTRTAEGQSLQQEEDARSDGGRMEDAMEDQFFDTFPGAVGGSSDGEDDMDEDSDDSEDSANNEEEDGDHEERFYSADDIFDADQIFGPGGIMAAATTVLHAPLAGSEEEGEEGGYASAGLPGAGSTDAATSATPKRKPSLWTLQGVYPVNPTVDFPSPELSDLAVAASEAEKDNKSVSYLLLMPVRAPLQGSLTGREPIVGYNGDRLQHLFPDLSHMGVGLRHLSTVFIPLPTIYTDLYQMVRDAPSTRHRTKVLMFFCVS